MNSPNLLEKRFNSFSPRLNRPPVTIAALLLHGGALAALVLLIVQAWEQAGLFAWSVGLAYIAYDTLLLGFVGAQTLALRRMAAPGRPAGHRPTLAVLIAAHNEAAVLRATVEALLAQAEPPEQIVIADDGSS